MVQFINGEPQEATTEELLLYAKAMADTCHFEEFSESLFRLGSRGIDRETGLELIKRFKKDCVCHNVWDDYSDDPQDY